MPVRRQDARFEIAPYDFAAAEHLGRELGVSHVLAQVLVRRGLGDPVAAQRFLAAEDAHPLDAFGGLRDGAGVDPRARRAALAHHRARRLRRGRDLLDGDPGARAADARRRRRLVPAQPIDDGYGLAAATVERLAARGTDLLVTVDCAITAVAEVAAAKAAGMAVVVTDHHAPRADGALPDATIVHPRLGGYPCPDLCAAGVAYKLARRAAAGCRGGPCRRRRGPRPRCARHGGRRRLPHGREPAARARRPAQARGHAQAGPARADGRRARRPERRRRERDRLPPRARGSMPPGASTAPTRGSSCC